MTKFYIGGAATAITIAATAICTTAPALAKSDNAAAVIKDQNCTGFVPTDDGQVDASNLLTSRKLRRYVQTRSGVTTLICQFKIPDNQVPSRIRQARGFLCQPNGQSTEDSQMVATPGGHAVLICKVRG